MAKQLKRPKKVPYTLIPEKTDAGKTMYALVYALVDEHHEELSRTNVRIALAWATGWKPDVDGRVMLGKCKKATDLDRELAPFDFVILLNRDFWQNPRVTDLQRRALLDHELMHAAVAYDENGDAKVDDRGRTVYRIRKHDLEEFSDIAQRYGCWKRDIEAFMRALSRADAQSTGFVGYSSLREALKTVGVEVPLDTIVAWTAADRRDVLIWTRLRQDDDATAVNATLSDSMPACLAAALAPPSVPPARESDRAAGF